MKWECSECGAVTSATRRPIACGECGTAGVIFGEMGPGHAEDPETGGLRETWLEAGLMLGADGPREGLAFV